MSFQKSFSCILSLCYLAPQPLAFPIFLPPTTTQPFNPNNSQQFFIHILCVVLSSPVIFLFRLQDNRFSKHFHALLILGSLFPSSSFPPSLIHLRLNPFPEISHLYFDLVVPHPWASLQD